MTHPCEAAANESESETELLDFRSKTKSKIWHFWKLFDYFGRKVFEMRKLMSTSKKNDTKFDKNSFWHEFSEFMRKM